MITLTYFARMSLFKEEIFKGEKDLFQYDFNSVLFLILHGELSCCSLGSSSRVSGFVRKETVDSFGGCGAEEVRQSFFHTCADTQPGQHRDVCVKQRSLIITHFLQSVCIAVSSALIF